MSENESTFYESPYAAAGGFRCMYCGVGHSSAIECRSPCTENSCTWRGIPWKNEDGKVTSIKCYRHKPRNGIPLPVSPPQNESK